MKARNSWLLLLFFLFPLGHTYGTDQAALTDFQVPEHIFLYRQRLCKSEGNLVKQIATVEPDSFLSNEGLVSWVTGAKYKKYNLQRVQDGNAIEVHELNERDELQRLRRYELPEGQTVKTTAVAERVLYFTGKLGEHILCLINIDDPGGKPIPVPLPKEVKRKTFDDLLIDGNQLIAIDNVVHPKWIVLYDITDPASPITLGVRRMMDGFNQHVLFGALSKEHLVLFCESVHMGGKGQGIEVYDRQKDFEEIGGVGISWGDFIPMPPALSTVGDLILLSGYRKGVKAVNLEPYNTDLIQLRKRAENDPRWTRVYKSHKRKGPEVQRMFLVDRKQTKRLVKHAFALPELNKIAVWFENEERGFLVTPDQLILLPEEKKKEENVKQDPEPMPKLKWELEEEEEDDLPVLREMVPGKH